MSNTTNTEDSELDPQIQMFHSLTNDDFTFGVKQEPELDLNADEQLVGQLDVQEEEASESVDSLANSHGASNDLLVEIKDEPDLNYYDEQTEDGRESGLSNFEEFQITFLPEEEDGVFKCTQCPTEYLKRTIFLNHLKTHQYANVKCPYCPRTFVFAVYMEKHIRRFHKEHVDCLKDGDWRKMFAKHTGSWYRSYEEKNVEKEIFKCFQCGRTFVRKIAFMKHMQGHKYKCSNCSISVPTPEDLKLHMANCLPEEEKPPKKNPFTCPHCPLTYKHKLRLEKHVRTHRPNADDDSICPIEFESSEDGTSHKETHLGIIRFKCRHCSKRFLRKDRYLTHLRLHGAETIVKRPHQPKKLVSSTNRRSRTTQHSDSEDDDSDGQDPLCVLSERKLANPSRHKKSNSEKKLLCPHCPLTYKYKLSLEKHIETHQPNSDKNVCVRSQKSSYSCPYCPLTYKYKPSLEKHIITHQSSDNDSQKPIKIDDTRFRCPNCPRIFSKKNRYLAHLRWHGGEQNIKCPHCPKMFLSTKSLELHTRFHNV